MCHPKRMQQVTAHLFLRSHILDVKWDANLPFSQDICWLLDIIQKRESLWIKLKSKAGCWHRHTNNRITNQSTVNFKRKFIEARLCMTNSSLSSLDRLTPERSNSIFQGLWEQVDAAIAFSPIYWFGVAKKIKTQWPGTRPEGKFYNSFPFKYIDPIILALFHSLLHAAVYLNKKVKLKLNLIQKW
jgi:hypothetical protein